MKKLALLLTVNGFVPTYAIYRSPHQELTTNMQFIDHLTPILKAISKFHTPTIISGDQNYNV